MLVVVVSDATMREQCLCQQSPMNCAREPRWQRTLHHRGLRKLALDSRRPGGARKMAEKGQKTLHHPIPMLKTYPSLLRTGMSTDSGNKLNLRHLHCRETQRRCMITATSITAELHLRHHDDLNNKDIDHLVRVLQLRNLQSFQLCHDPAPVVVQQRARPQHQEHHLWDLVGLLHSLHCGYTQTINACPDPGG